jgi:archaeal flagellar protein FlaJ
MEAEMPKKRKISRSNLIGIATAITIIIVGVVLLLMDISGFDVNFFFFVVGIAVVIGGMPFLMNLLLEAKIEKDKDQMFLEFSRDLVEGVKSGTPISKTIINTKAKDYGALNPYVDKLANQIALGIPVKDALEIFARDVNSSVIARAVSLIKEAEKSGGKIETILESVSASISQIEVLKKERKAAIYNLTVQGYIIFLIFIAIMLVLQFKILPIMENLNFNVGTSITDVNNLQEGAQNQKGVDVNALAMPFLFLLIFQGLFAGLVIGKISEGKIKYGFKHSFIMVAMAWLISSGARILLYKPPVG